MNTFSKNIVIDNESSVLDIKYKHLCDLFEKMISDLDKERPSCYKILRFKYLWALNAREFINFNDFEEFKTMYVSKFQSQSFLHKFMSRKIVEDFRNICKFITFNFWISLKKTESFKFIQ